MNSEFWPTKEEVAEIRKKYPEGTKIEVIKMDEQKLAEANRRVIASMTE